MTGLENRIIQPISRLTADFSWEFLTFHRNGPQTPFDSMIITFIGISNILTTLATLRNVNGIRQNKQGVARNSVFYAASPKNLVSQSIILEVSSLIYYWNSVKILVSIH